MGLHLANSPLRSTVDPVLDSGTKIASAEPGDAIVLRARTVVLGLADIEVGAVKAVEGPYLRFTPEVGADRQFIVEPWNAKVGESQAWSNASGVAQTTTVADDYPPLYWEVDALANVPFVAPTFGTFELRTGIGGAWIFDGYVLKASSFFTPDRPHMHVYAGTARQTRYIAAGTSRDLDVPLGAFAFEIHSAESRFPIVSVCYEDSFGHVSGSVTSTEIIDLTSYQVGNTISTGNARKIQVNATDLEAARIVWHIAIPRLAR